MTPFAITVFYVLTTLNGAGQSAPVDKAELPAGVTGPITWSEGQCFIIRGKMKDRRSMFVNSSKAPRQSGGLTLNRKTGTQ